MDEMLVGSHPVCLHHDEYGEMELRGQDKRAHIFLKFVKNKTSICDPFYYVMME